MTKFFHDINIFIRTCICIRGTKNITQWLFYLLHIALFPKIGAKSYTSVKNNQITLLLSICHNYIHLQCVSNTFSRLMFHWFSNYIYFKRALWFLEKNSASKMKVPKWYRTARKYQDIKTICAYKIIIYIHIYIYIYIYICIYTYIEIDQIVLTYIWWINI